MAPTPTRKAADAKASAAPSKKRGRPPKVATEDTEPPKKRGRPSKSRASEPVTTAEAEVAEETENVTMPKKRGRPSKAKSDSTPAKALTPKKRGRPAKEKPAVSTDEKPPPKKRGRPPKGGETTRITHDDVAAAEQLEEELVEAATYTTSIPTKPSGKQYFLMKAEQEDRFETLKSGRQFNTKFTIDDLREKKEPEMWDGVRNYVARNVMKEMRKGDLAFFYASAGKQGRKPGITGIMEIVGEPEPDPTTHDRDEIGYVEKEADRDKWVIVRVEFRKKLNNPVTLATLQENASDGGKLSKLHVLNAARLSVSRVSQDEWEFIVNELIVDGYDDGTKGVELP